MATAPLIRSATEGLGVGAGAGLEVDADGNLASTGVAETAEGITETSGPTALVAGAIANGAPLVREGTALIGRPFTNTSYDATVDQTPVPLVLASRDHHATLNANIGAPGGVAVFSVPNGTVVGQRVTMSILSLSADNDVEVTGTFADFVDSIQNATPALGHSLELAWNGAAWEIRLCAGFLPVVP